MNLELSKVSTISALIIVLLGMTVSPVLAQEDLRLKLSPDQGQVGTRVTISGQVPADQIQQWSQQWANDSRGGYFHLGSEFPPSSRFPETGCELLGAVVDGTIRLDPTTGKVSGSFIVPSTGTCFQNAGTPLEGRTFSLTSGVYWLSIGCHACSVADFTILGALPRTGASIDLWVALSAILLTLGVAFCVSDVRRRRSAA